MSFISEISKCLKVDSSSNRYVIILGCGGYFEGVKNVLSFNDQKIELLIGKKLISIEGNNLNVKKYLMGDVCIEGNILQVTNGK